MGKFVAGALVGVALLVGAVVGLKAIRQHRDRPTETQAQTPTDRTQQEETRGRETGPASAATRSAASPAVTPLGLLAQAQAAGSETDRLAAYERLARLFPRSAEARTAREQAQQAREAMARTYRAEGDSYRLRNVLSDMLWKGLSETREAEIKREIVALNQALIFSRRNSPDGAVYTIRPGDAMQKIAGRHKVTAELLTRINGIRDPNSIRAFDTLKVVHGPFDLFVELGRYRLTVLLKGRFVREYRIGVGEDESTPVGRFAVNDKLTNPTWYGPEGEVRAADDPKNPLGERWIGITGGRGYGIHGTIEPESVGTQSTRGCIRMLEAEVEEVFDFVVPKHSRVTIVK